MAFAVEVSGGTITSTPGAAGAGTAAAAQRVTLASDDPAVALLTTQAGYLDGLEGVLGATSDAAATQGSTGSISAKLRTATSQLNAIATTLAAGEYETVAASQTAQVLGATGGTGDYIAGVLVVPATTSPGQVLLLDNATSITVFVGGATSVGDLKPFLIPLGMISVSGAWKITTGSNVSCIGIGNFT